MKKSLSPNSGWKEGYGLDSVQAVIGFNQLQTPNHLIYYLKREPKELQAELNRVVVVACTPSSWLQTG